MRFTGQIFLIILAAFNFFTAALHPVSDNEHIGGIGQSEKKVLKQGHEL